MTYKRYRVRLYPNQQQATLFEKNVGCCRFVYNKALALQIKHYEQTGEKYTAYDIIKKLPALKAMYSWLKEVDHQSLVQTVLNLENAYKNFFRRAKQGGAPGFPKFKKKGVCRDSFRSMQQLMLIRNYLRIGKHGWIKTKGDLDLLDKRKIRNITVIKEAGKWYASCLIEVEQTKPIAHNYQTCGIDIGVKKPIVVAYKNKQNEIKTLVKGYKLSSDLKRLEKLRKRRQKQLSRKQKGSKNRDKAKLKVQVAFKREVNVRKEWIEQTSNWLTNRFHTIKFEDLNLQKMTKSAKGTLDKPGVNVKVKSELNRELLRLGFGELRTRCEEKAAERGSEIVYIDARFTSQKCFKCKHTEKANRKNQAKFKCIKCKHKDNADRNAAKNILVA